jgi:hypothetical protein
MYVKIKGKLVNLELIHEVSELGCYDQYQSNHFPTMVYEGELIDRNFEYVGCGYWSGFGFIINYLNDNSSFVKLSTDFEDSKRIYDEFLRYLTKNQSNLIEIV